MTNCNDPSAPAEVVWIDDAGVVPEPKFSALSISAVAKMFKISPFRLRYWELRGLIGRQRIGASWVYSWADCDRIAFIIKCRKIGLRLAQIAPILAKTGAGIALDRLQAMQSHCLALINRLSGKRRHVDEALGELQRIHAALIDEITTRSRGDGPPEPQR